MGLTSSIHCSFSHYSSWLCLLSTCWFLSSPTTCHLHFIHGRTAQPRGQSKPLLGGAQRKQLILCWRYKSLIFHYTVCAGVDWKGAASIDLSVAGQGSLGQSIYCQTQSDLPPPFISWMALTSAPYKVETASKFILAFPSWKIVILGSCSFFGGVTHSNNNKKLRQLRRLTCLIIPPTWACVFQILSFLVSDCSAVELSQ